MRGEFMKPFLLFVCDHFYPTGGWDDFVGGFATKEDAISSLKKEGMGKTAHIVFMGEIIWRANYNDNVYPNRWNEV